MLDLNVRLPRKQNNVEVHDLGAEFILHDTLNRRVHVLNKTAFYIWDNCDGQSTAGDLIARMRGVYCQVGDEFLQNDVQTALDVLRHANMVVD